MDYLYVLIVVAVVACIQQVLNNRRFNRHMKLHELQDISIDAAHNNTVYVLRILSEKGFSGTVPKDTWVQ